MSDALRIAGFVMAAVGKLWPIVLALGAVALVVAIIRDQRRRDRERGDGSDSSRRT